MLVKGAVRFYKTVLEVSVVGLGAAPAVTRNHLQNIRNLCGLPSAVIVDYGKIDLI
jgi:hypothetical protein